MKPGLRQDLPEYKSKEVLEQYLRFALEEPWALNFIGEKERQKKLYILGAQMITWAILGFPIQIIMV